MQAKTLFFVVGIAPTPDETARILALAETGALVEVISVEKMQADAPVNLAGVQAVAGSVPTNYAEAFEARPADEIETGTPPADLTADPSGQWAGSDTAKPAARKR
ncbi:MAG: hypothetical protein JWR85_4181 [Marmoricola sp.]|nr:hypothetical protein [Marmoricola sp.]